jgi:hypothetical protein
MTPLRFLPTLLALVLVGCGEDSPTVAYKRVEAPAADVTRTEAAGKPASPTLFGMAGTVAAMVAAQPGSDSTSVSPPPIARKIIYDAQVDLVVDGVDPIARKVATLVQGARGYIAEQNVAGSPGSLRSMRWRIRVPVEQFDSFVESIVSLGELERNNRTSQDVSEQYYDIEARIKNKRVEEQTLNKILQERSGKLEDVLKIEIELSRVRGEIEQLEGKIRVLQNLSSLATLTLNVRERDKYAPPPPVVADFSTQVARAWDGSLRSLIDLGKSIVLWTVRWVLWIPIWVIVGVLAWLAVRLVIRVFLRDLPRIIAIAHAPIGPPRTPPASG